MSIGTTNGVLNILVGSNPSPISLSTVQITDPTNAGTYIADGQIIILNSSTGLPMTGATANIGDAPNIQFVQRSGSDLHLSARIRGVDIVRCTGKNYLAPVEQVTNLGYNGTSGSLDVSQSTDFIFTLVNDWDDQQWSQQKDREAFDYSSINPTQLSLAQSFSYQVNFKFFQDIKLGTGAWVSVTMLNDGTAASPATAVTAAVVNNSDIVTLNAADAGVQVIGTQLRLGSTGSGRTTTIPVYVVVGIPSTDTSLTANQVRIHTAFQGVSATALSLTADAGVVTGATNYGLVITGLPLTFGIPPYSDFKFKKVSFHIDRIGFGASTYGTSVNATQGSGTWQLVSELEYFAQGFEGALNRTIIPLPTGRHDTVTGATYDVIQLTSADKSWFSPITNITAQQVQTILAIPAGATQITTLLPILNSYIASTPASLDSISIS